jgi:Kelch motif protein
VRGFQRLAAIAGWAVAAVAATGCGDGAAGPDAGPDDWMPGPALPGGRLEASVSAVDGALWVIGGLDDDLQIVTDTWILDPGASDWRAGPPAPAALTHLNAAVVDGDLYLLGGLVGSELAPTGESYALHPATGQWRSLAPMPPGQARGAAAVIVRCRPPEAAAHQRSSMAASSAPAARRVTRRCGSPRPMISPPTHGAASPILPTGRAGTGGAVVGGRLWVAGGAHRLVFDPTADVDSLGL